jgi:hypothetical protein
MSSRKILSLRDDKTKTIETRGVCASKIFLDQINLNSELKTSTSQDSLKAFKLPELWLVKLLFYQVDNFKHNLKNIRNISTILTFF